MITLDIDVFDESVIDAICWRLSFVQGVLLLHQVGYPTDGIPLGIYTIEELYEFYEAYIECVCKNLFGLCSLYWIEGSEISLNDIDYELSEEEVKVFRDCSYHMLQIPLPENTPADLGLLENVLSKFKTEINDNYWGEIHVIMSARIRKDITVLGELLQINPPDLVRWLVEFRQAMSKVVNHA